MEIIKKSEDQWSQVLEKFEKVVEGVNERFDKADESAQENMRVFKETADDMLARIEHLEDKGNNPDQRQYTGKYDVSDSQDTRQALGRWLQDCYRSKFSGAGDHDLSEFMAIRAQQQTEGTAAEGGNVVPSPLDTEIHRIRDAAGVARRICRSVPMSSKTLDLPTVTSDPSVVFDGAELTAPTNSGAEFGQEQLQAKKIIATDKISSELAEDTPAAVELFGLLAELFGEAVARKEDLEIFQGTGATFSGILSKAAASVVPSTASFAGIGYDDVVNLMHSVDDNLIFEGTFVFHPEILKQLRKIKDADNNPIWAPMSSGAPATILGRPYVLANQMPSVDGSGVDAAFYGVPNRFAIIGNRRDLRVDFSDHAAFTEDGRWMRVVERLAFVVTKGAAFGKITTL